MQKDINYAEVNKFNENIVYLIQEYPKIWAEVSQKIINNTQDSCFPTELVLNFWSSLKEQPDLLVQFNALWQNNQCNIMKNIMERVSGAATTDLFVPEQKDQRFKDEAWTNNSYFDYLKQTYLMTCKALEDFIAANPKCNELSKKATLFLFKQIMNAVSPSNFIFTNPTILNEVMKSNAQNLVEGVQKIYSDLSSNNLKITNVDLKAFTIGKNIATTKGKVILREKLFELIAYYPKNTNCEQPPILIIPPLINKYYILDLQEKNSLIKWLVDNDQAVFVISWVNATEKHKEFGIDEYLSQLEAAVNKIIKLTKAQQVSIMSYCIGGTLSAILAAYLAAKKRNVINTCTFLATFIDFSEPGDLGVFVNDAVIDKLSNKISNKGYLDGSDINNAFNLLRSNDMVWSNVVNHYLLGKEPVAFDILYWNADNTRIPAKFYNYYLQEIFLHNKLIKCNELIVNKHHIDLSKIQVPCYFLATKEDHIVLWTSAYKGVKHFKTDSRFVLAESGHVSGILSSPNKSKYGFYHNNKLDISPEGWLEKAKFEQSSWWVDWIKWYKKNSKSDIYVLSKKKIDDIAIMDAPGSYVHQK